MNKTVDGFLMKTKKYMTDNGMDCCDCVVVGLSGGADSVCLVYTMKCLSIEMGLDVCAVHLNHGIRGAEADRDEQFVRDLCDELGVELRVYYRDIPLIARERGLTEEEAGRIERYRIFGEVAEEIRRYASQGHVGDAPDKLRKVSTRRYTEADCEEYSAGQQMPDEYRVRIAVAHNSNDNAETVIHNMLRGSALRGVTGIRPVRGSIIRPILWASRTEIEELVAAAGLSYVTDSTNLDTEYTRNRIRNVILPQMTEINARAVQHINSLSEDMTEVCELIDSLADEFETEYVTVMHVTGETDNTEENGAEKDATESIGSADGSEEIHGGGKCRVSQTDMVSIQITAQPLRELSGPVAREVCLRAMEKLCGRRKDITRRHLDSVLGLTESGKSVDLPYGMRAERSYEYIIIEKSDVRNRTRVLGGKPVACGETKTDTMAVDGKPLADDSVSGSIPEIKLSDMERESIIIETASLSTEVPLEYSVGDKRIRLRLAQAEDVQVTTDRRTEVVDFDLLGPELCIRHARPGDTIVIDSSGGTKKLSKLFTDMKLTRREREQAVVVADGDRIVWVVGYRLSEGYKVTFASKRVMYMEALS